MNSLMASKTLHVDNASLFQAPNVKSFKNLEASLENAESKSRKSLKVDRPANLSSSFKRAVRYSQVFRVDVQG